MTFHGASIDTSLTHQSLNLIVPGVTFAWILAGCGLGGPTLYPVSGVVVHDGQPVPEAEVILTPENGRSTASTSGTAITDHDGRFTIESGTRKGGLPKGRYRVRVGPPGWHIPRSCPPGEEIPGPSPRDPTDNTPAGVVPREFRTEETTPIRLDLAGPVTELHVDVSAKQTR